MHGTFLKCFILICRRKKTFHCLQFGVFYVTSYTPTLPAFLFSSLNVIFEYIEKIGQTTKIQRHSFSWCNFTWSSRTFTWVSVSIEQPVSSSGIRLWGMVTALLQCTGPSDMVTSDEPGSWEVLLKVAQGEH